MTPLLRVVAACRQEAPLLVLGAVVSVVSVVILLALSAGTAGRALSPHVPTMLVVAPFALQALGVGRVVARYTERMVTHAATFRTLAAIRVWLWRGLAARSAGGLGYARSGDALSRMISDTDALDGLYLRIAIPALCALLLLPVLVWAMQGSAPFAAVIVIILFIAAALGLPGWAARQSRDIGQRLTLALSGLRVATLDAALGLREVTAYGAGERMLTTIRAREDALITVQDGAARHAAIAQACASLCSQAALLTVVLSGGPALVPALFLTLAAFETVGGMPRAGVLAGTAASAAGRIVAQACDPLPVADPVMPAPAPSDASLAFDAITFAWRPGRPLLQDFSLHVDAGSRVALLGPSGAGKSTVVALALKVITPASGRVALGGTDVAHLSASTVRGQIAWLGQNTHIFQDTVRENLLLGAPGASDANLWRALDTARLADRVAALPGQLDTVLGGRQSLSGGEQRRLALARAILSPAPILILDEPAAGLDAVTEAAFFRTLADATAGRTVLMIVHRLTGAERVDRVWRLSAGRAVSATG